MTENLNAMTPAERELWRVRKVQEEEEQYQARVQHESELQLQRTESYNEAEEQAQLVAETILKNLRLSFVVGGEEKVREATIRAGLIDKPGILRGHFWGFEAPNCGQFGDVPGGIARVRQIFSAVQHPQDLASFRQEGVLYCAERHYSNHAAVLVFRGLKLSDLGLEACVCSEGGPGHQYKNVSTASLSSAPWRFEPNEEFDCPPGAEEDIEAYLRIGYVSDLKAPKKVVPKEEKAKPTPQEILEQAIAAWERDDD